MDSRSGFIAILVLVVQGCLSAAQSGDGGTDLMGIDFTVQYFCMFFSNSSYACKSDCLDGTNLFTRNVPDKPDLKYTDLNCSIDIPPTGAVWRGQQGILKNSYVDRTIKPPYIVATCAFYTSGWYECQGVADCSAGNVGFLTCAGSAPWRGYYQGTAEHGFTGNITAEAMNAPPMMNPSGPSPVQPGRPGPGDMPPTRVPLTSPTGVAKKVVASCEKFAETDSSCYSVAKSCGTIAGKRSCNSKHVPIRPRNDELYRIFDLVVSSLEESSVAKAADIVAQCHFYDNREYTCGFPFAADFRQSPSFSLRPTTGTFYRASY
ncbi:hypothetical protein RvY_02066-2 [Ramazzottius varieornatus]|uniref:Uncharacterized protein n=1 Tax=Ramazzottius varieornatus TaxID=947166 RepID=A0A1D1UT37_RAMVA|nr:hypothetical protein RvY_02066-2 [Ramazzottius varieornatus]